MGGNQECGVKLRAHVPRESAYRVTLLRGPEAQRRVSIHSQERQQEGEPELGPLTACHTWLLLHTKRLALLPLISYSIGFISLLTEHKLISLRG